METNYQLVGIEEGEDRPNVEESQEVEEVIHSEMVLDQMEGILG